jgi:hypothetical protein
MARHHAWPAALALLALVGCAQTGDGGGSGTAAARTGTPPAPAFTWLTKDEAVAKGGRVLTAEEVRERVAGKTCTGQNRIGDIRITNDANGTFTGRDGFSGTWRVNENGEYCYEAAQRSSCQALVLLDGKALYFDEQGRHRATSDGCS